MLTDVDGGVELGVPLVVARLEGLAVPEDLVRAVGEDGVRDQLQVGGLLLFVVSPGEAVGAGEGFRADIAPARERRRRGDDLGISRLVDHDLGLRHVDCGVGR